MWHCAFRDFFCCVFPGFSQSFKAGAAALAERAKAQDMNPYLARLVRTRAANPD